MTQPLASSFPLRVTVFLGDNIENTLPTGHPERQSSSANQPSFHSASLELFARDLHRNQRFRLGLRTGITSEGQVLANEITITQPHQGRDPSTSTVNRLRSG